MRVIWGSFGGQSGGNGGSWKITNMIFRHEGVLKIIIPRNFEYNIFINEKWKQNWNFDFEKKIFSILRFVFNNFEISSDFEILRFLFFKIIAIFQIFRFSPKSQDFFRISDFKKKIFRFQICLEISSFCSQNVEILLFFNISEMLDFSAE